MYNPVWKDPQLMESQDAEEVVAAEFPAPDVPQEVCRFETDLAFLWEVGRRIAPLAARPGLAPETASVIERAVAALQKLPEPTPGIDLQVEISHRMGDEEFNESYSYVVKVHQEGVEVGSSGTQYDAAVGSNSFSLESFKWRPDGQVEQEGNRDTWLERLEYALGRDYTVNATDESVAT
jgi:hypothetical protein